MYQFSCENLVNPRLRVLKKKKIYLYLQHVRGTSEGRLCLERHILNRAPSETHATQSEGRY